MIVQTREELRPYQITLETAMKNPKIKLETDTVLEEVIGVNEGGKKRVTHARLKNVKTGEVKDHEVEGIFLGIGHKPNTDIFKGQIELEETGYIKTSKVNTNTNIPGVFACGDAQDHVYRQAITAAGSGCMAAIDVERYLESTEHHS